MNELLKELGIAFAALLQPVVRSFATIAVLLGFAAFYVAFAYGMYTLWAAVCGDF